MPKKLPVLILALTILCNCEGETVILANNNQLKGVIKTFILKTPTATTKTKHLTGFKTYNVVDNALLKVRLM